MLTQSKAAIRTTSLKFTTFWPLFSYLMIGLVALKFRTQDLGGFVTLDEINFWIHRSETFLKALQSGDYAATAISTHPGVTTMWLGSAGILLRRALFTWGFLNDHSFSMMLALIRLPVVLTHVAGILLGYRLLRRLLPATPAALAAFLWAVDPFVIGYSRLLHVDALAGTFATLSLLAACAYWYHAPRRTTLVLSGVCAGLAILSKSPALAVLPIVVGIALATWWQGEGRKANDEEQASFAPRSSSFVALLAWCAVVAVTVVALWPALWIAPAQAYQLLRTGVEVEGAQPHMLGNFFLGQEDDAPSALFYPVALALRLTPWTLIGLLMLWPTWRRASTRTRHDLAALAGFVVLFIIAMSVFPKKFNRYLVPVFPTMDILAAVGLAWITTWLPPTLIRGYSTCTRAFRQHITHVRLIALILIALLTAASWDPYEIAVFNSALGGAPAGARTFLAGWGEGLEQVAAWLNQQPDITGVLVVSTMTQPLQPYLRLGAQAITPLTPTLPEKAGYVVIYIRDTMGVLSPPFDQFFGRMPPSDIVRVAGVDYAWIYQVPPPVAHPRPADFGPAIHLRGFTQTARLQPGKTVDLKLFWETSNAPPTDYVLFAHLLARDGKRYAQLDLPYPTSHWQANRYITTDLQLTVPASAPAGRYKLVIGLYDPSTKERLPLVAPAPPDLTIDGNDALILNRAHIRDPR
jgi:4-amino-4-deoxy-L-arabinose transferase-like glycosyltransferase